MLVARASGLLLAIVLAAVVVGCGSAGIDPVGRPVGSGSVPRPQIRFAHGEWIATGTIIETHVADGHDGEIIVRPWDFARICREGSCRMMFQRQTTYGMEASLIEMRNGRYVAEFSPESVPCPHLPGEDAGISDELATFTLWWSAGHQRILAVEHSRYIGRSCGNGETETIRWVAKRTHPNAVGP